MTLEVDGPERTPFAGYAAILGSFGGALALTTALERRLDRARPAPTALDLVLLSAATFKVARAISRERVGSVVREPFVETDESADGSVLAERPAGEGLRRAIGELVTCTRCTGTWAAAGLLAAQTAAPQFGRLLTWALAAGGANDFLHAGFVALCDRSHLERASASAYSRGSPGSTARRARSAASSRSGSSSSSPESQVPFSD